MNLKNFMLCFVPLFVAVDAFGTLPLFIGLTEGMERRMRQRTIKYAVLTALTVAVGFIFLGKTVFHLMGITVYDFMVAGGVLLFAIASIDLLSGNKMAQRIESIAAVPLGIPLIVGPAVLTTGLMLVDIHGVPATLAAMTVNILLAGGVLLTADFWTRLLGAAGSQAASKVASLLLAAIAVMMIRKGLVAIITAH
jgi:multiple antibiotic resistance protein